ncbi:MAG: hypothetical protein WC869_10470 [Phycisphaerae bacterium]|jgi:hypothetical protein
MSETTNRAALIKELASRRISYSPAFARIGGGVTAGVLLAQLLWYAGGEDKWTELRQQDIEEQTMLTRDEQETARRKLKERGILEERLCGVPARLQYHVMIDRVIELLAVVPVCGNPPNKIEEKPPTSMGESTEQVSGNAPNKDGETPQTLLDLGSDPESDLPAEGVGERPQPPPTAATSYHYLESDPEAGDAFTAYKNEIGGITPAIRGFILDELNSGIPGDWIVAACAEAAAYSHRSWIYVKRILDRWRVEGFQAAKKDGNGTEPHVDDAMRARAQALREKEQVHATAATG